MVHKAPGSWYLSFNDKETDKWLSTLKIKSRITKGFYNELYQYLYDILLSRKDLSEGKHNAEVNQKIKKFQ